MTLSRQLSSSPADQVLICVGGLVLACAQLKLLKLTETKVRTPLSFGFIG
jgi:hypothetical protein